MKHIVVPIDFSQESLNGLRMAIVLANRFGSTIQMVYVQKSVAELGKVNFEDEKKEAKATFKQLVEEYSPKLANGAGITYIVKKGKVFREVVNQAGAYEDSVIVCSTHGASGFEEFFMGSNAFKIISATDVPVFAIRFGSVVRNIENIVLPIDLTSDTRQKVPLTAQLAKAFNARVHVLGVATSKNEEVETKVKAYSLQVCEYFREYGLDYLQVFKSGDDICSIITDYSLEVNADLISIMTEQNEPFTRFIIGTHAQQILNQSTIPVLCVTPKELFLLGSFRTFGSGY